jgi:hypothetical protein
MLALATGDQSSSTQICAVKGCDNAAVEVGTIESDEGLIIRTPICEAHRDYAVREGIAGRRWELLFDHGSYTVERER